MYGIYKKVMSQNVSHTADHIFHTNMYGYKQVVGEKSAFP
jgi:hypothetical protein